MCVVRDIILYSVNAPFSCEYFVFPFSGLKFKDKNEQHERPIIVREESKFLCFL
jgi:hypothetical protein